MQERKSKRANQTRSDKYKVNLLSLPPIPNKRYFSIGEVSHLCSVKPYVLRYWESEFPMLKPIKRRGNRRYYQYDDVLIVRKIIKLLYEDAFTIEGARAQLGGNSPAKLPEATQYNIVNMRVELESLLQKLK